MASRVAAALCLALLASGARAEESRARAEGESPKVKWTNGPAQVELGAVAEMKLDGSVAFAGADDTQALLHASNNPPSGAEVGLLIPTVEGQSWFLIYEYHRVGYIKDDDKDRIDADAILASIRENTEKSNEERKKAGGRAIHVVGWQEPPHYDAATHNLVWSILGRTDDGHETVNYDVRVLGREGYMSVTLVEDPSKLEAAKPALAAALGSLSFKKGKSYAEWVPGDKVAEYGLTALVAAGAGAAAAKLGVFAVLGKLLAKAGKLVVVVVAGLGAGLAKLWNAARGRMSPRARPPDTTS
jgi:uncharacterized membrane-anchored protein